jgi:hypothetical protein
MARLLAEGWHPLTEHPAEPCMVLLFSENLAVSDAHGRKVTIPSETEPYRDYRFEVGFWDGEAFCDLNSGHDVDERRDQGRDDAIPTLWKRIDGPFGSREAPRTPRPNPNGNASILGYGLTPTQATFCRLMAEGKTPEDAASASGYLDSHTVEEARMLLTKPHVRKYIRMLKGEKP